MRHTAHLAGFVLAALAASAAQAALTWTGDAGDYLWKTTSANWTADGGATHVVWTQGQDAIFDGEPASTVKVSGGAIEFSTITVMNIADGSMSISKVSGNDVDHLVAVGAATINVPAGTSLQLPQVRGTAGLTITGGGSVSTSRGFNYTGGTTVLNGTIAGDVGSPLTLLDTSGSYDAALDLKGWNGTRTLGTDIIVQAGSTGTASISHAPTTSSGHRLDYQGNFTLNADLTVIISNKDSIDTFSGNISGPGDLILDIRFANSGFVFTGDNSGHSGNVIVGSSNSRTGVSLALDGTMGTGNVQAGNNVAVSGTGTVVFNVAGDVSDLISLTGSATLDLIGLTLLPVFTGIQTQAEYPITNRLTGVVGPFLSTSGFTVDYDGTATWPDAVVLMAPPQQQEPIPEPASALLVLAGAAALARRRRRA